MDLLKEYPFLTDVKICFCMLCSHDPAFGHCYACPCGNHLPEPTLDAEGIKLKAAVEHFRQLLKSIGQIGRTSA